MATEALSIREPNIKHVKLLRLENNNPAASKILIAICKLLAGDSASPPNGSSATSQHSPQLIDSITSISPGGGSSGSNNNSSSGAGGNGHINHHFYQQSSHQHYCISIVDLLSGDVLREIAFNSGDIIELKSNADLLCVNSWNRVDGFDMTRSFEHCFSITTCFSQVSKSTGKRINPIALGNRWLAFADNKVRVCVCPLLEVPQY